jgi:hypothetical protein
MNDLESNTVLLKVNEYFFRLLEKIDHNKDQYLQDNKKAVLSLNVNISCLSQIVSLMSEMNYSEEEEVIFKSLYSLMKASLLEREDFLSSISS